MIESRELYHSSNGDRWFLVREANSGRPLVLHEPNKASGGDTSLTNISEFLVRGHGPEQEELLRLIGTLIERR
jgi:hypothetical protein